MPAKYSKSRPPFSDRIAPAPSKAPECFLLVQSATNETSEFTFTSKVASAPVEKMQKLRAQGLCYGKIADVFNAWSFPTKTRKGPWSAKQIHQILKRPLPSGNQG